MEQENTTEANWRQLLRLVLASYVMLMAFGLASNVAGNAFARLIFPDYIAPGLLSVTLFVTAYFILIGQRLRRASFVLLCIIIMSRINMPVDGLLQLSLFRDAILVAGLLLTGGWFVQTVLHIDAPGRIRLARITLPSRTQKNASPCIRTHAFAQSPDDMGRLFDQISEV